MVAAKPAAELADSPIFRPVAGDLAKRTAAQTKFSLGRGGWRLLRRLPDIGQTPVVRSEADLLYNKPTTSCRIL